MKHVWLIVLYSILQCDIYFCEALSNSTDLYTLQSFRHLLNGKVFKVAAFHMPPYVVLEKEELSGTFHDLLQFAATSFNFTLHWNVSKEVRSCQVTKDGKPAGLMAEVYYGAVDFTAITAHTHQRYRFMDMTHTIQEDPLIFITTVPRIVLSWTSIFSSYNMASWNLILCVFCFYIVIYFMILSPRQPLIRRAWNSFYIPYGLAVDQTVDFPKKILVVIGS